MCGITGFADFANKSNEDILNKMLHTLKQRGPDDQGQQLINTPTAKLGLGHARLAILDLSSAGHQPYHFEHLSLVYNGEIYNFLEIQKSLLHQGYTFSSNSDTEVLIKAIHCWGINAIQQCRGMFAFCLYDAKAHKLYLCRDRTGVKPLYYYYQNSLFLFGSSLAPILSHPQFKKQLNHSAVAQYLQFGYLSGTHSIFQHTFKLKPGHFIILDLNQQSLSEHGYWNIQNYLPQTTPSISLATATEELDQLLQEAFKLRMIADVPVGCFLSGGIDSSLVVALLQKQISQPLHTFTIGFENEAYNEAPKAKAIANYLGTRHTEYYCTEKDAQEVIPLLSNLYDEPFADESAIPTYLVAKLAKQHVKVALSGDGGDELFGGYRTYEQLPPLFKLLQKLPQRALLAKLAKLVPDPIFFLDRINTRYYKKYLKLKSLLSADSLSMMHQLASSVFSPMEVKKICNDAASLPSLNLNSTDIATTLMLTDFLTYLPEDILLKVDRATMYVSLEGREPFLDHKIIEYATGLPPALKKQKYLLKNILARYLPRPLFEQKKQGFGLPINQWLRTNLKPFVETYLSKQRIQQEGLFNPVYIEHLKQKLWADKITDNQIWIILMFQMWQERYL